ncbi:MAG: ATP-dependent Clp protease ATP-binding subunit [Clostridiales bacterium]|jgi:ATP-dependent Clp protease ATP-binding subunit ClpC|nr:ATP-dependent Clp protease ATP-binding subunit [Clostridiales bacterium]
MNKLICSKCKIRPAVIFVSKIEGERTTQEGLCIQCAMKLNIGPIKEIMDRMGISEEELEEFSQQFGDMFNSVDSDSLFEAGGAQTLPLFQGFNEGGSPVSGISSAAADESATDIGKTQKTENDTRDKKRKGKKNQPKRKYLNVYCTDLTEKARNGQLDRIIGREDEIYRVTQILCRRTKNNPCLIGEPGVGKTAIAEGLALRIATGDVPAKLANKELHLLDLTALVAGTQFRGQFESRIKGLVDEVKSEGNIILFIDEVHNLVGTGDAEGSMNAANILKPALSRGEIQVIGATTFNEYRKHIEKDAALERRFQPVKVTEPSIQDTYEMLKGIKSYYEDFHKVTISDSLLYKAVVLSERYITDRFLPDKAIDLLDEACTCANLRNKAISEYEINELDIADIKEQIDLIMSETDDIDYEELARLRSELEKKQLENEELKLKAADNAVLEEDLAKIISLWLGIPVSKIIESDLKKLANLENKLKQRIVGQDDAIAAVAAAVRRSRVQISPQRRPASFIFVGPTGVGKTELVKQLANELFDTPETLIRLDMSEFMEKHSVSRIIGSPPGYVGYDEAGQLTEKVRRKPYSVILLDEIEKAHPDVLNILLQILDEGKTSDAQGRTVSFENTVIIMTSNAGSERKETSLGFAKDTSTQSKEKVLKALSDFLRPEFIGRVDEIVVFNPLSEENYVKIAEILLNEMVDPLKDKGIKLSYTDEVPVLIAKNAYKGIRGARDVKNEIRRKIEDKIATIIIDSADTPVSEVLVSVEDGEIKVQGK